MWRPRGLPIYSNIIPTTVREGLIICPIIFCPTISMHRTLFSAKFEIVFTHDPFAVSSTFPAPELSGCVLEFTLQRVAKQ